MTVTTTNRRITYIGNGSTTAFPVPFPFAANGNLNLLRTVGAVTSSLVLGVDYLVAGAGNEAGGTVTLNVALANAARLTIRRQSALTQLTDYTSNDPFPAEAHELALDLLTMITQEITDDLTRAILVPDGDAAIGAMLLPSVATRQGKILGFDAAGLPVTGPTLADVTAAVSAALAPANVTVSQNVTYTPPFTGGVASTLFVKSQERLSAFDFMTVAQIADVKAGTLTLNVTVPMQAAINAASLAGKVLHVPAGRYLVSGLTIGGQEAGRTYIEMDPKAVLAAASAGITVLDMGPDIARLGPRILRGGRIDGRSLANVIGIQTGGDGDITTVALYTKLQDVTVTGCSEAVVTRNSQELICEGLIFFANRVGFVALSSNTGGGSTVFLFSACRFQNNRVNFFGKSNSIYPIGGWHFSNCTFQNGLVAGMALYGGQAGNGALTNITMDNCHFEGSGEGTTDVTTETVRGEVVPRGNILLTGTRLSCIGGELGANLVFRSFVLRDGAVLTVRDANIGGGVVQQFDCDASSEVFMEGSNFITGSGENVRQWAGWTWDGVGSGGAWAGSPLLLQTCVVANQYQGAGVFPNAPEAGNTVGATVSKVRDQCQGEIQRIVFLTSVGSTGANRAIIDALGMAFATGDRAAVTMLVKSTVQTVMSFVAVGGVSALFSGTVRLQPGWQRVVLFGRAVANEAAGFNLFTFPSDASGATIDLAKIMVVKLASAAGASAINEVVRQGWYDDMRSPLYAPNIPATGTWPRGRRIVNSVPTVGQARAWTKVTSGANNVLGTDWISEGNL